MSALEPMQSTRRTLWALLSISLLASCISGLGGRCTGEAGILGYFELDPILRAGDYQLHWHEKTGTPFAYNASSHTFISYDDPKSVALKVAFVNQRHLGGAMF